ncbi:ParB/RepB/Spo0J family partition protein, partial [Azohydromonas lata]|uniref:ParB/RepB/Spo0J family partition protein n=1 Tax=Azohydromonas lata TaxID=45677 RepID=UPI00082B4934
SARPAAGTPAAEPAADAAAGYAAAPAAPALVASERPPIVPPLAPASGVRPKTGPGLTTMEILDNATLRARVSELEQEVQRLAGERGALLLDAREIAPSRWANRHADSFRGPDFEAFKTEILDAGGNVQPIMVRPLEARAGEGAAHKYEVVFGHRRHRACLELGVPVSAVVKALDDRELFGYMERENRLQRGLSAYEQGHMYRRALDEGMFPSLRQLAGFIGRGPGDVSNAMHVSQLPQQVLDAFASPNDIQFRWTKKLKDALDRNRDAVLAEAVSVSGDTLPAAKVFKRLVAAAGPEGVRPSNTPAAAPPAAHVPYADDRVMDLGQRRRAAIRCDGERTYIEVDAAVLPPQRWLELEEALQKMLADG